MESRHHPRQLRERKFLSTNVIILIGMLIVAYQLFTYAKKVYQDYQVDLQIEQYEKDIASLKTENESMQQTIEYLKTDSYREKVAKGVANYKNPGEDVIIVKGNNPASDVPVTSTNGSTINTPPKFTETNPQKWWRYFFGDLRTHPNQ